MKEVRPCPLCQQIFREHRNKIEYAIREHVRSAHPEANKEISEREHEIREIVRGLKSKFPNVAINV